MLPSVQAQQKWKAGLGAQSADKAKQAIAFLPNEMWIHAGDSITWTSGSDDIHTVTFLKASQPLPFFANGCPGFAFGSASYDGSTCVSTTPQVFGQAFTVTFPKAGNFKLVCLVHPQMTGVIHVLGASAALPHTQAFYDEQAEAQQRTLFADADKQTAHHHHGESMDMQDESVRVLPGKNSVATGAGEIAATPGGFQSLSIMRFLDGTIEIEAGDTVEWSNSDPATPHTITLGVEPANPGPPSANVFTDADGALHAVVNAVGDSVHSGLILAAAQDQLGVATSPPGPTRFRVTFKKPGTYAYKCALHDNLGMVGKVIVKP